MTSRTLFRAFSALCPLVLLASCAEMPSTPTAVVPTPTPAGYWNGDGVPGSPKIVVSISEQHAYFYKGKQIVGESTVSTGKPGFGTPPGHYSVVSKDKDHVSTVFGDYVDDFGNVVKSNIDSRKDRKPPGAHYDGARMPYAMFFRGGYAMHQGYVPPYAASHGCIRLPQGMAEPFFENAPVGTPVVVKQEGVKLPPALPALNPMPPPSPILVRPMTPPASVRPASVRSTVPAPTPVPVRSPGATFSRAPAPLRSPAPALVPSPSPAPVRSPAPIPVRSAAPSSTHPTLTPTPSPTPSRRHRRIHSRAHVRSPAPFPTPTPAQ
jgi:hypothetical protein